MQQGRLNIVLDAQWGSAGKGKVCDWLTSEFGVTDVISGNMPNAGHTVVRGDDKRVLKVMPSAAPFNNVHVWLSGASGFTRKRFYEELDWLQGRCPSISDRAFLVTENHAELERATLSIISSTMQGSATALVDKIMRQRTDTLRELSHFGIPARQWRDSLLTNIKKGCALYEISQGWGLSIDHGTQYPYCTSRNCSTARALDDCAVAGQHMGDVVAVIRPYPIRVGNTQDGYSGDWTDDSAEVDWDHVKKISGVDYELRSAELTTVTKRVRRVSTFSFDLVNDCVKHNGVTGIFLNFAQYIDASCYKKRGKKSDAPKAVRIFADAIERNCGVPVIAYGTGADSQDVLN